MMSVVQQLNELTRSTCINIRKSHECMFNEESKFKKIPTIVSFVQNLKTHQTIICIIHAYMCMW